MTNPTGYTELDLVGFTDKGEYSPSANYVQNDIVQYNYVAWRCKVDDTTGITPIEGTNWTVFVGNPPSTSVTGVKGNAETTYRTGNVNITHANLGMDTTPTANSTNPVTSGALKTALDGKLGTSGASTNTTVAFTSNDLAANTTVKTNTTTNQPSTVAKLSSGETLASMFNKISSMFASIRKLWNTVGSTAIDTAYGTTLTAQMANLKSYNTYSTSETWTGKYWVDGKKIYRKVVDCGTLPINSEKTVDFDMSAIDNVINVYGICTDNISFQPIPYIWNELYIGAFVRKSNNKLYIWSNYNFSAFTSYITVEYTKTT